MRSANSWLPLAAGVVVLLGGALALLWLSGTITPVSAGAEADAVSLGTPQPGEEPALMPRVDAPGIPTALRAPKRHTDGRRDDAVCSVHGRVLDHTGAGVPSLTVKLYRGQDERQAVTDADGRFAFTGLQRGVYRAYVDSASLPANMLALPVWKQELRDSRDGDSFARMHGTSFRLEDESDPQVDLRVYEGGTVRGWLVDSRGKPIVAARIEIHTADGLRDEAKTDAKGGFVFDEAHPGRWATSVDLARTLSADESSPLPRHFELAPGGAVVLDDLVAGVGGHILRGGVTDLAGQPVAGLGVLCQEESDALYRLRWTTVTDADGRYELGRVPATRLVVSVGAEDRDRAPDLRLLAENVAPIRVDTRGAAETVELAVVTVAARRPFQVRGRVEIERGWGDAERPKGGWRPRVELSGGGDAQARAVAIVSTESDLYDDEDDYIEWIFTWTCATPHAEVEFRAVLEKQDGTEIERLAAVTPSADGTEDVLLRFP